MALSTELLPQEPFVFLQTVTANATGLDVSLQPLSAADRTTPVGNPIVATFPVAADGAFVVDLPGATIPPAANPISGTTVVADIHMVGAACPAGFCGTVTGQVTQPIAYQLTSSTFRAEPVMGMNYPEPPPIDCGGTLADPL